MHFTQMQSVLYSRIDQHRSNCTALESVSRNTALAPNISLSGSWFMVKCINASRLLGHVSVRHTLPITF